MTMTIMTVTITMTMTMTITIQAMYMFKCLRNFLHISNCQSQHYIVTKVAEDMYCYPLNSIISHSVAQYS